jgi:hypothetical protein
LQFDGRRCGVQRGVDQLLHLGFDARHWTWLKHATTLHRLTNAQRDALVPRLTDGKITVNLQTREQNVCGRAFVAGRQTIDVVT